MPDLFLFFNCIVYISSHDYTDPVHVHVAYKNRFGTREGRSEKIWVTRNGDFILDHYKGHVNKRILNKIIKELKNNPRFFQRITEKWSEFFDKPIEYYGDGRSADVQSSSQGKGRK